MTRWDGLLTVSLGNVIVLVPMLLARALVGWALVAVGVGRLFGYFG